MHKIINTQPPATTIHINDLPPPSITTSLIAYKHNKDLYLLRQNRTLNKWAFSSLLFAQNKVYFNTFYMALEHALETHEVFIFNDEKELLTWALNIIQS